MRKFAIKNLFPGGSARLGEGVQSPNAQVTPVDSKSIHVEVEHMGTPSAPPIIETEREVKSFAEVEQHEVRISKERESEFDGRKECSADDSKMQALKDTGSESTKNTTIEGGVQIHYWQSCLDHSPCYNTRLHKFLFQPRGMQMTELRTGKHSEQMCAATGKKVVGKIRVEVRKLRIIPRWKLRSTHSLRGAMNMQE
ncbi:uncharacterized protein LOC110826266 isoform X2 [Carica papaya]|uniref:uncharacterized protein LOC110826266 isoform X2 n=1 Tax=Carica papaya TaxID=3649 RepID=UPI000B8CF31E|nr:uncharacterized protein LOC110826266 isoform X2 [Carica papaya]